MPLPLNFILTLTHDRAIPNSLEFNVVDSDMRQAAPSDEELEFLQLMSLRVSERYQGYQIIPPVLVKMAAFGAQLLMEEMPRFYNGRYEVYVIEVRDGNEVYRKCLTSSNRDPDDGHDIDS